MVDFVEEVEEQLRSERYASLARRYLPWFGAALAATVVGWLGAWGYQSWNESNIAKASVTFDKAVTALASGDQAAAAAGFAQVAQSGPSAYKTLALMEQANTSVQAGDAKKAARQFDAAAKAAPNEIFRNLAQLRAAQAIMDTAPYAQVETRLKPLIGDKKPYTLEAREMLALAKLQAGRLQDARADFNALTLTLGASQGMKTRAQGAIALIDSGQAALVGAVVKAAVVAPPPNAPQGAALFDQAAGADSQAPAQDQSQDASGTPQ